MSSSSPIRLERAPGAPGEALDPYSAAHIYYGAEVHTKRGPQFRTRTYSNTGNERPNASTFVLKKPVRRGSHDEIGTSPRQFVVGVADTLKSLAEQEANLNMHITIEDMGPKVISVGTASSNGFKKFDIRGTYMLANLLQELHLAKKFGRTRVLLDEARLNENPVNRLSRLIKDMFWDALTRRLDSSNIAVAGKDPKDWTDDPRPRIYIPVGAPEQFEYYTKVAEENPALRLDVCWLPANITPEAVRDMNDKPGILALAMHMEKDKETNVESLRGVPFVVPGGRFNELYGWDSYMESLGLIANGKVDLAKGMVKNFCFCIEHYGKILNANRSYYLSRSQPPFLTDMALRVFEATKHEEDARDFLRLAILAAIKEYNAVWMAAPRLDPVTGLSRYRPEGMGIPPETEPTHFTHILEPYAEKHGVSFEEFVKGYNNKTISEPELDEYFLHDRAVRESGHDTSYRLEKVCANLATIDLNSLLYKYEKDIEYAIRTFFNDRLVVPAEFCVGDMKPGQIETSSTWERRMKKRKAAMNKYLWNEKKGMFFDYNTVTKKQALYESATSFWALWAGMASAEQASKMVKFALPMLEEAGGLASGTESSRGTISLSRPNRQWDYPYGWAPQQMLAWSGLERYGYEDEARRLAYKWLFMMTKAFVDYHGVVVEKYNVTSLVDPHRVDAEYGNQGLDFTGVATTGFGWVNASYVYGLTVINTHMRRALGNLVPWPLYESSMFVPEDEEPVEEEAPVAEEELTSDGVKEALATNGDHPTNGENHHVDGLPAMQTLSIVENLRPVEDEKALPGDLNTIKE